MPTRGRRAWIPLAVRWFAQQTYSQRELIVVDDGDDPIEALLPADPAIRYLRLAGRHPVGVKRNQAAEAARGELLAHWDDDDWFAPHRLEVQVAAMQDPRVDLCGLSTLLYHDLRDGRCWQYRAPPGRAPWLSLLCYRRALWQSHPHPDLVVGSDTAFVRSIPAALWSVLPNQDLNVCLVHDTNTSPKVMQAPRWQPVPRDRVQRIMGPDRAFYPHLAGPV